MILRTGILADQITNPVSANGNGGLGIAVLVIGLALITHGTVRMLRSREWRASAFPAEGRVVDNLPQPSRRGRTVWLPLIEFEANGRTVRFRSVAAATPMGWPIGHAVDVLYDPRNPNRVGMAETGWHISMTLLAGLSLLGIALAVAT